MNALPYFINPDIDALATADPEERKRLARRIAANVGDEATLRAILGIDPEEFANFYPDMLPPELSTEDTISTFISRFSSEKTADTPEIDEIVAAPAIDYASMLELEEGEPAADSPGDATGDAISAFLQAVPAKLPRSAGKRESEIPARELGNGNRETKIAAREAGDNQSSASGKQADSGSDLSEALFKLMVKNKNYSKALEIITELSLNNPKKSVYFAHQTRFLKKLIKNQENSRS